MGGACGRVCGRVCGPGGGAPAAGSVLDRVISQASSEDHTVLYKLADYHKGGLLMETYTRSGAAAAERLIREELPRYLYAAGRGVMINRAEYLRWKFRDQEHVMLPIEASLSPHDPLAKWRDHEACWQMRYRGALGESLLHVLIICDTKIHTRVARTLLKCFPRLAVDVVEGEEYLGSSSLHLAIAYSNNELVQDLVEAGADVSQRAIGSFFLPRDQQLVPPARHTDYEGLAYLGEYPLAWAACCANEAVYNLLLDNGADPDASDGFGNSILHMVVVCDKLDMFGYALRHPRLPASNGRANHAGFTPLTLACQLGRAEVFREMLELSAREFWRYSNITCSGYPLNALDTLLPDGRTNWNSALFIILNGTKEEHLAMLDGGIIQRLLEEKWKTFARKQFLKRLLILLLHLLMLSVAIYLRPTSAELDSQEWAPLSVESTADAVRLTAEVGTLVSTLSYLVLQQGDEIKNQGVAAFFKQLSTEPAKAIFLASNTLLLAAIPARLAGDTKTEEAILVFAVPGCWFLLMFFAGAIRLTGPFVTMIYSMITGDMFTFGIIYCIILFGFSQSFFFLYKGFPNVQSTLFSTYPSTWMALFQITLGDYSYSDLSQTTYPNLAKSVFALFMVFVPILLLNMLIAMMGNTYAHVIEQSEKEWVKQWAKIVVSLERAIAQEAAHGYIQEYSMGLGPSDDPRYEQRAVMVIKSKAKTRAKQRKGALANWKRVGKVTISELRRRGMSGEELRRLMWGRVSISTPTKIPTRIKLDSTQLSGVGTALTSALDVMAFTHDLDLTSSGVNNESQQVKQPTPDLLVNGKPGAPVTASTGIQSSQGLNPAPPGFRIPSSIMHEHGGIPQFTSENASTPTVAAMTANLPPSYCQGNAPPTVAPVTQCDGSPAAAQLDASYTDYLRELVLAAERGASGGDELRGLAARAAQLDGVPLTTITTKPSRTYSRRAAVAGAVSGLFGVTPDAPGRDGWSQRPRASNALASDSDGQSDSVLLGRASRARRVRSASRRAGPPPPHFYTPARSMYLVASESDAAAETEAPPSDSDELGSDGIPRPRAPAPPASPPPPLSARPACVEAAVAQHQVFVAGEGSGAETEEGAPTRRARPHTARRNRISPEVSPSEARLRPWATAPLQRLSRLLQSSGSSSEDSPARRY